MKSQLKNCRFVLLLVFFAPATMASEAITVGDADIERMGILFAPVAYADADVGPRFPATVINSPDSVATLTAPFSGRITEWRFIAGDSIRGGEIIATIRSPDILQLQNDWISSLASLENADFELEKDRALLQQGVISQQRVTQTRTRQQQAAFAEQSAKAQLSLAGYSLQDLRKLREENANLGSYFLVAPTDGQLTQRMGGVGDYVATNDVLAFLNSGTRRWVSIHLPARLATDIAIGQTLTVAASRETLTLRQKDFIIDSSDQTIELFAEFDAHSNALTGQVISVILPPGTQGILIPDRAVVHSGDETTVFVRTSNGVEARNLSLRSVGANYLATAGIEAGEEIAIQGAAVLKGIQLGLGDSQ